ncbi:MAG: phage protease [Acidobacteriota bacterium]
MKATISRWVSASAHSAAMLLELSAAATTEIELVGGKVPMWITLIPAGTFRLVDGRGPFRNFDPEAIISASNARRGNTQLPGDYDHHIDNAGMTGVRGIACGWVEELKAEGGAVRARVRWTKAAADHLAASEYRYISPRFGTDERDNVVCVVRFALTNNPAIKDLPAIAAAVRPISGGDEISASDLTADQLQMCRDSKVTPEQFSATRNAEMRDSKARV